MSQLTLSQKITIPQVASTELPMQGVSSIIDLSQHNLPSLAALQSKPLLPQVVAVQGNNLLTLAVDLGTLALVVGMIVEFTKKVWNMIWGK